MSKKKNDASCRLGKVGGQAVLEGVMMKAGDRTVTSCRKPDGTIYVHDDIFTSVRKKNKFLDLPIIRGLVNFIEMMKLSVSTMSAAAEALGIEEEEESKFEKWLKRHFNAGIVAFIMVIGVVLGALLAVTLFLALPTWISQLLDTFVFGGKLGIWTAVTEGVIKVIIFLAYLWLVSLIPDIKRTFMYHGAEHKSIACFEAGDELTPERAKEYTRFHPRCGTSFMFLTILIGIAAGFFIKTLLPNLHWLLYSVIRIGILPILMGLGYEVIRLAGKHDNVLTRIMSAPGLWAQRLTTKEPTEDMLEIAITSLKCALRDDFPEFREFYESRGWEEKPEADAEVAEVIAEESDDTVAEESAPVAEAETVPQDPDRVEELFEEITPITAFESKPEEEQV